MMVDQVILGLDCSSLDKRREQSQLLKTGYDAERENNKNLTSANLVLMDDRDKWQRKAKRRMKVVLWGVPITLGVGVTAGIVIITKIQ